MGADQPLAVRIVHDVLTITIGVDRIIKTPAELGTPHFDGVEVVDAAKFAASVGAAMTKEREDGSTLLSDMVEKACEEALGDGAEGVEYPTRSTRGSR